MLKKITLLILLFVPLITLSQQITGTIKTAVEKETMPFVTVSTQAGNVTTTDLDGRFQIEAKMNDTISFSFVGYQTQKWIVSKNHIEILLSRTATQMQEVMVTALGVTRQKREIGYSTEKVEGKQLAESNSPNILNAITGKAAGVQIANPDGVDGGTTRITIRGNNSVSGNNQPLIVVDGIPLSNDPGLTNIGRGQDWGSAINNINMLDVEDVQILKGGAASALYGSRGANGVILITMKKGKKQNGLGITYNTNFRLTTPYRYREVQNVYGGGAPNLALTPPSFQLGIDGMPLYPQLSADASFGYPGSSLSWGPKMEGQLIRWWDGYLKPWIAQPDNIKIPFQNGSQVTHNVSVEGGGDIGTLRVSISRTDNTPIVHNSNFDQTSVATAGNIKVSDKVNVGISGQYIIYKRLNSPMLGESENSFNKALLYSYPRNWQGEDYYNFALDNGTRNPQDGFPYLYIDKHLWWNYFNRNTNLNRSKWVGGVTLNYAITPWLNFMGRTGLDYTDDDYETKGKPADVLGLQDGYYSIQQGRDKSYNHEFLFTTKHENILGSDFNLSFNLGGATWNRNMSNMQARSGTWYFPNWYNLSNFTQPTYGQDSAGNTIVINAGDNLNTLIPTTNYYKKRINSIYSFANISFKDYLFIELTARNDWSSTLPDNANAYFYPGMSVSFIATEAFNFKSQKLSFLKLRAGASQTATDTDPFQTEFYYKTSLFGAQQASTYPNVIPPTNLKPQRVNDFEVGTNIGFFDDRLTLDFTYYYKYAFDQILKTPLPGSAGASSVLINEGAISNNGFEVILNSTIMQRKDFTFKAGLNLSRNRNRVVSLGDYADIYILADIWGENGPQMALQEGDYFGTIVGWDYVYKDGKPVVNEDGTSYLISDKRVPLANAAPDFLAGFTTEFKYKNFTIRTLIDTKWGGSIYSGSYVTGLQTGQSPATLDEREGNGLPYTDPAGNTSNIGVILPGVHADGTPNTTVVHYYYKYMPNAGGWGHFLSRPGVVENTWVKFREIVLAYNMPIKNSKVFRELNIAFTARDLFYIYTTLPDRINPEGILGAGDAQGFEWGALPGVRSFSLGLNVKF
jgi:iron complex outermembrane receptor protein